MKSPITTGRAGAIRAALAALTTALLTGCATTPGAPDPSANKVDQAGDGPGAAGASQRDPALSPHAAGAGGHGSMLRVRAATPEPSDALPAQDLTPQILFQVLAAEIAAQRGQAGSASATYLRLAKQTKDPRLARRATELALAERSVDHALQGAQLWHEYSPGSALAAQTYETLLLSTGRLDAAEPLVAARLASAREQDGVPAFYRQLQRSLGRAADKKAALALFDRVSAADADVPQARLAAAELAQAAGLPERAATEAERAFALKPDDEQIAISTARIVQDTPSGAARAAGILDDFLQRHPKSTEARFNYARLLAGSGKADAARAQMELALREEPDSPPILFSLAQIAYQTKQLDVAEDYLKRYLALPAAVPRDNGAAYLFLGQIEEDRGRLEQAIDWLAQVTRGDQFMTALVKRSLLIGRLGRVDEARELLRNSNVTTTRERVQLIAAEAQVLRDAKRYQDAFDVLDQALASLPDNPDLLYDQAMAAEKIDRLPVMEVSLRRLIELRPDSAHAYNALGYSLADRNLRLDEAYTLIEKAVQLAPKDAHILDSMGWVLYRQGRLEQAAEYLRKAFELRPEAEIAAHLGEVLWQLGRTAQARELWREAQGREPNNETLKETLARLNVAL